MPRLTKSQMIENILVAQAMLIDLGPRKLVKYLEAWNNEKMKQCGPHSCGSAACFGGWVAIHPHFKQYGVFPASGREKGLCAAPGSPRTARIIDPFKVAYRLFGDSAVFDINYTENSDYKEVMRRLELALNDLT